MRDKPQLRMTRDYALFELHECNRPLHDNTSLLESMRKNGFMPSSPIQCIRNGDGKLKVVRGHNRLECAKRLKLPVWYVIDGTNTDIFDLEGDSKAIWSLADFAIARAKAGDMHCMKMLAFRKKHGLTLGAAVSLVGGESPNSGNKSKLVKLGTFRVGDMKLADKVVRITDACREQKVSFATSTGFVRAISMAIQLPEFDSDRFIHAVTINGAKMQKRTSVSEYLTEIEGLYNYGAKSKRFSLAFLATEASRKRKDTFGGRHKSEGDAAPRPTGRNLF